MEFLQLRWHGCMIANVLDHPLCWRNAELFHSTGINSEFPLQYHLLGKMPNPLVLRHGIWVVQSVLNPGEWILWFFPPFFHYNFSCWIVKFSIRKPCVLILNKPCFHFCIQILSIWDIIYFFVFENKGHLNYWKKMGWNENRPDWRQRDYEFIVVYRNITI